MDNNRWKGSYGYCLTRRVLKTLSDTDQRPFRTPVRVLIIYFIKMEESIKRKREEVERRMRERQEEVEREEDRLVSSRYSEC